MPLFLLLLLPHIAFALWPIPATLDTGTSPLILSPDFNFDIAIDGAPADLYAAAEQAEHYLQNDKLGRLVVGRGANDSAALTHASTLSTLRLTLTPGAPVNPIASESVKPLGTRCEEYILIIPDDGSSATLTANSTLGLYRGLTTFGQLWYYYGGQTYTLEAPIAITDKPAYVRLRVISGMVVLAQPFAFVALPWIWAGHFAELVRITSLPFLRRHDVSLCSFPVVDLLRTLEAMSWVKINVLHWHITDAQSFPLEVAQYPGLAANGAYSAEEIYSESDVQYVVQFAAEVCSPSF